MKPEVLQQNITLLRPNAYFPMHQIPDFHNGLIVRMPNHLGDAVMALPALCALKSILPRHCGLFVITPESSASLFQALPEVDAVIQLKQPHKFYSRSEVKEIRQLHPGAAVLFNHSFRDAVSLKLAGVKFLYGEPGRCRGWMLTGKFPFPCHRKGECSQSHQAMRYLAIAEALGGKYPQPFMPQLIPSIPPDELPDNIMSLLRHPLLLTIAPGAAYGAAKRWPHEYYTATAAYWIRRGGIVALVGVPNENGICTEIHSALPRNKCINLCGKTNLTELMHLFRFSAFAFTNDSGLMHLASALRCPGMTVFGPTDPGDTGPVSSTWKLIYAKEKCSPCLRRVCPKGNAVCMKKITPSQVIRILNDSAKELKLPLGKYFHR
ncbi:MAG: lipopolysaccharide heptosyltransferase II [Lentisphaeria bacterium]|nr:lipopolysaccharide heptosyltransferase II [Lentisphaeria bacterium]